MASGKYNNYSKYLTDNGYTVSCTLSQFLDTKKIVYSCESGHTTSMAHTSFGNKKASSDPAHLCSKCIKQGLSPGKFEERRNALEKHTGHILLTWDSDKKVTSNPRRFRKMNSCARAGYVAELWVYRDEKTIEFKKRFSLVGEMVVETDALI